MIEAIINQYHHELYVDLDSIFDTRLACLEEVDVKLALLNLQNGWDRRIADAPLGISETEFRELYAVRDLDTLSLAVQTPIFEVMRHWLLEAIGKLGHVPVATTLTLAINFFPYKMHEHLAREIATKIYEALKVKVKVELLFVDPKELTPQIVRNRFDGMIMYDGFSWIKSQEKAFEVVTCPQTTLYVPSIYPEKLPTSDEIADAQSEAKNIFREMEIMMGPMVGIEFLNVELYSAIIPAKLAALEMQAQA